jgi:hypothetical protein
MRNSKEISQIASPLPPPKPAQCSMEDITHRKHMGPQNPSQHKILGSCQQNPCYLAFQTECLNLQAFVSSLVVFAIASLFPPQYNLLNWFALIHFLLSKKADFCNNSIYGIMNLT